MDLRGDSCNLESGGWLATSNCPHRTGFRLCEWLLEAVRVDSIDRTIGGAHRLSPIVGSSESTTELLRE